MSWLAGTGSGSPDLDRRTSGARRAEGERMAEDKPGFFGRLFGRKPGEGAKPAGAPDQGTPPAADLPREQAGSVSEGAPDFTTAAAAGEIAPAQPTVTQATPDLPQSEKPAPELAG